MILKEALALSSVAYTKANLIAVRDLAEAGLLKPLIAGKYSLFQVNDALDCLKTGAALGRSMVVF